MTENTSIDESIEFVFSDNLCHNTCLSNTNTSNTKITAVIGATVSLVSIPTVSFFRLFNLPQLSSLSSLLSNHDCYFHTIPSDDQINLSND